MKKLLLVMAALLFVSAGTAQAKDLPGKNVTVQDKKEAKPFNTVCPVSGEDVDKDITYEFEGKTYALCCKGCVKKFKKDPQGYISALSEDGKSWDKSKLKKKSK